LVTRFVGDSAVESLAKSTVRSFGKTVWRFRVADIDLEFETFVNRQREESTRTSGSPGLQRPSVGKLPAVRCHWSRSL